MIEINYLCLVGNTFIIVLMLVRLTGKFKYDNSKVKINQIIIMYLFLES
jgi:hypothetical protein